MYDIALLWLSTYRLDQNPAFNAYIKEVLICHEKHMGSDSILNKSPL